MIKKIENFRLENSMKIAFHIVNNIYFFKFFQGKIYGGIIGIETKRYEII